MPRQTKPNETTLSLVLDRAVYANLQKLAREDSRSARNYIQVILARHVEARLDVDNIDNHDFTPPGLRHETSNQ